MKYLFILTLFAVLIGFIYWRLRPYLRMARQMLGMVREVRRMSTAADDFARRETPRPEEPRAATAADKLVRCASCGTWLPSARVIRLRSSQSAYCSHACLERAADTRRPTRQSAS